MTSTATRRTTTVVAASLLLGALGAGPAVAANGTGSVSDSLVATVVPGLLTIAGVGANVAFSATPGQLSSAVGATVITVSDLTASTAGWAVTATYTNPVAGEALGGENVLVSATGITTGLTGVDLAPAVDEPLDAPVTVATTGAAAGTGVTTFIARYKVRVPADAQLGDVYGGTVTYTVASVR